MRYRPSRPKSCLPRKSLRSFADNIVQTGAASGRRSRTQKQKRGASTLRRSKKSQREPRNLHPEVSEPARLPGWQDTLPGRQDTCARRSDRIAALFARRSPRRSLSLLGVFIAALFLGLLLAPAALSAPDVPFAPARLSPDALAQMQTLEAQAEAVKAEINALDVELEQLTEEYNALSIKLDEINVRMATLRRQLTEAEADHAYRVQRLEERIRAVYKAGGRDQLLEILLLSGGASDFFNRLRVVAILADQDNRLVENLKESTERLNSLLADLDREKRDELAVRSQMDRQRALVEAKLAERHQTLAAIDSQVAQIIAQERQRELEEQERLRQALARLLNGGQHYEGPLPQTDDAVLNQFIETAVTYLGIPYMWGGDRPSTGFDCSGFTQFVYAQHGVDLPHYSVYQANLGIPVELKDIQPGDLVAFGFPVRHVGIYIGNGLYVHAPQTGDVVKISSLSARSDLAAIRRFALQPRTGAPAVR